MRRRDVLALALLALPLPARAQARRIVIAGGDLAEIAFALGAGGEVVGVDTTTTWPPEAYPLPRIGYLRQLAAEGILSLSPDMLIGAHDAGPPLVMEQLAAAGVDVRQGPEGYGISGVLAKIAFMGEVLGRETEAAALSAGFETEMAEVRASIERIERHPRVLFVLSVQAGAPLVAGQKTGADAIIRLAGGENAAQGFEGYKPMQREAIVAAAPEAILMMDGHAEQIGGAEALLARPDIAATPAGQAGRLITMDGPLLLGFGPRTPLAVRELARALHGEAAGL